MKALNIIVVEDDEYKRNRVKKILERDSFQNRIAYTFESNVLDAKRALSRSRYDLLIIDIQIPDIPGNPPNKNGGLELLQIVTKNPRFYCPSNIVGVTAYEDTYQSVKSSFEEYLSLVILAKIDESDWELKISNYLGRLLEEKIEISALSRSSYQYEVCVLCALQDVEFEALKAILQNPQDLQLPNDPTRYISAELDGKTGKVRVVAAYARDMGLSATSNLATKMIYSFAPAHLFMTGVTAGVRGLVSIGDVIVADPVWDYGQGKYSVIDGKRTFEPAPNQLRLDAIANGNVCQLREDADFCTDVAAGWTKANVAVAPKIHVGPAASGAAVVADPEKLREIVAQHRKLLGIDMEMYAIYWASEHTIRPKPMAISFKGVSDYADLDKTDSNKKYAAYVSNEVMKEYVKKFVEPL